MAPEMMENKDYNYKVDTYGLGIIFYFVITGELPYGEGKFPYKIEDKEFKKRELWSMFLINIKSKLDATKFDPFIVQLIVECLSMDHNQRPNKSKGDGYINSAMKIAK